MITCGSCGSENELGRVFCVQCGGKLDLSAMTSEVVAEIRAWYLDTIEVYPGDTGVGGLSIRLPAEDQSLTLTVAVDGEEYQFPLEYTH